MLAPPASVAGHPDGRTLRPEGSLVRFAAEPLEVADKRYTQLKKVAEIAAALERRAVRGRASRRGFFRQLLRVTTDSGLR